MFRDRSDAGKRLARRLLPFGDGAGVVIALPRGGVPVGYEIARALGAPLGLVPVRKIGAPGWEELAIGALAAYGEPELVLNEDAIAALGVSPAYLAEAKEAALAEIGRRRAAWLGGMAPVEIAGRAAIVVDDGIATGATMKAALRATRRRNPARLVLAVPVAPAATLAALGREADACVALETPGTFDAVGQFYRHFAQVPDEEVTRLLAAARAPPAVDMPPPGDHPGPRS